MAKQRARSLLSGTSPFCARMRIVLVAPARLVAWQRHEAFYCVVSKTGAAGEREAVDQEPWGGGQQIADGAQADPGPVEQGEAEEPVACWEGNFWPPPFSKGTTHLQIHCFVFSTVWPESNVFRSIVGRSIPAYHLLGEVLHSVGYELQFAKMQVFLKQKVRYAVGSRFSLILGAWW